MKHGEAFGSLPGRRDNDAPVSRSLDATGGFPWTRPLLHPLRTAMQRLLRLLRLPSKRERLPHGWERGL